MMVLSDVDLSTCQVPRQRFQLDYLGWYALYALLRLDVMKVMFKGSMTMRCLHSGLGQHGGGGLSLKVR